MVSSDSQEVQAFLCGKMSELRATLTSWLEEIPFELTGDRVAQARVRLFMSFFTKAIIFFIQAHQAILPNEENDKKAQGVLDIVEGRIKL